MQLIYAKKSGSVWQMWPPLPWEQKRGREFLFFLFCIQIQWNFTGLFLSMSRWVFNNWKFQNGCRCHGNRWQMSKIQFEFSLYLLYRSFSNFMGNIPASKEIDLCKKIANILTSMKAVAMETKKGEGIKKFLFCIQSH